MSIKSCPPPLKRKAISFGETKRHLASESETESPLREPIPHIAERIYPPGKTAENTCNIQTPG